MKVGSGSPSAEEEPLPFGRRRRPGGEGADRRRQLEVTVSAVEVLLAAVAVVSDLFLPAVVLSGMAVLSLLLRRQDLAALGFHRLPRPGRQLAQVVALTAAWTVVVFGLVMPVAEHLTGSRQDVGEFADVEGDVGRLLVLVTLSWTLAALVEEFAFRGYLLTRLTEVIGDSVWARGCAVVAVALLFALIHDEQGVVGMVLVFVDATFYGALRYAYGSVWAPIVAHGVSNTIGMVAFFLLGPFSAFW